MCATEQVGTEEQAVSDSMAREVSMSRKGHTARAGLSLGDTSKTQFGTKFAKASSYRAEYIREGGLVSITYHIGYSKIHHYLGFRLVTKPKK